MESIHGALPTAALRWRERSARRPRRAHTFLPGGAVRWGVAVLRVWGGVVLLPAGLHLAAVLVLRQLLVHSAMPERPAGEARPGGVRHRGARQHRGPRAGPAHPVRAAPRLLPILPSSSPGLTTTLRSLSYLHIHHLDTNNLQFAVGVIN